MLGYHISQSNQYTIRTQPASANSLTMSLQDMTRLTTTTASLSGITYDTFESMLSFTASIGSTIVGEEYRATLYSGSTSIWHGTFQAFASQSLDIPKSDYENQNKQYISNESENKYVIMD
jgi:hypothetical protein